MVSPLYLAMTGAEISNQASLPAPLAYMACSFSAYTQGLSGIPAHLPSGSMLILNDRMRCQGHSPALVVDQLQEAITRLECESLLLDFQQPPEPESEAMARMIIQSLSCPVTVTAPFADCLGCPVFLSPAPLQIPLEEYLAPWKDREVWLEAALEQTDIVLTAEGCSATIQFPPEQLQGGFYEETLCCQYRTKADSDSIRFTLFDTRESLKKKLEHATSLGVVRAVGLWQELGNFP